jgi:hypothetical protein
VLVFHSIPPPTDGEVAALTDRVATKILALVESGHADEVAPEDDGLIAERHAAAIGRIGVPPADAAHIIKPRCAFWNGFSVHADVRIHENDRLALTRLLAYATRPPCPDNRLTRLTDGTIQMRLKRPWPGGATVMIFQPVDLVRRLASLIPPRRRHLITYYGLASSHAKLRAKLVALVPAQAPSELAPEPLPPPPPPSTHPRQRTRLPWAECPGRMTVLAFLTDPDPVLAILEHLGLPTTAAVLAPARARAPPDLDLFDGNDEAGWGPSHDSDPPSLFE